MSTIVYDETKHPRGGDGKFATKGYTEACVELDAWPEGGCLSCGTPADGELCEGCLAADDPKVATVDQDEDRDCPKCGGESDGGWCETCVTADLAANPMPLASAQDYLPIDTSKLPRNPYAVEESERDANEQPKTAFTCPACNNEFGTSLPGECGTCVDEYGRGKTMFANPLFLRETFEYEEFGTVGATVETRETSFSEKPGELKLGPDSVGAEARVRRLYATSDPKAPYVERVVSWHVEAIGPDDHGGSTNVPHAGVQAILKKGEDLDDHDIELTMVRTTSYNLLNTSTPGQGAIVTLHEPEPSRFVVDDLDEASEKISEEYDLVQDPEYDTDYEHRAYARNEDTFDPAFYADSVLPGLR